MKRNLIFFPALCALLLVAACVEEPVVDPPPSDAPRLLVVLVVDQLGGEHLTRFDQVLAGGLRKLIDEGVSFREAHHDHAGTTTSPGHATIATGCHPSEHGIVSNYWVDRSTGETVYSVEDDLYEGTPVRLECSTLGDWLKERYPASRVFGLSPKDRSAVLLAGRSADGAYWYDWEGSFVSSAYFREFEPQWLADLNGRNPLADSFGEVWTPLPFEQETLSRMEVVEFDLGPLEEDFPHVIGGLSLSPYESFYSEIYKSPWMDEHVLRVARELIVAEELGQDRFPDLLAVSFSTADAIGHSYGPDSREFFDNIVRLDRELGAFFDWLDESIGLDSVAVVLTSDHGSVPVPELRAANGLPGARVSASEIACLQAIDERLDREIGEADWLRPGPFFAPLPADLAAEAPGLRETVRSLVEACPSVAKVWLAEDLSGDGTEDAEDSMLSLYRNSFHPQRSPDLAIQWEPYFLASARSASSHGTPQRYDTHVPLIFWRPGLTPSTEDDRVRTVDIAPTLAAWAGVEPPSSVSGRRLIPRSAGVPGS